MSGAKRKLFGEIAVSADLIMPAQLNEGLRLQKEYEDSGVDVPRIGEILSAKNMLTAGQVRSILKMQETGAGPEADDTRENDAEVEKKLAMLEKGAFGDFHIEKRLGIDSSGFTYRATHIPTDLLVTLHVLSRETMEQNPDYVVKFRQKVEDAKRLRHPNIQRVVDAGRALGRDYYAAEYVEGVSFRRILEERKRVSASRAVDLALQAAKALEYAHAHGICHRELQPGNIVITVEQKVKVIGFGVVRDPVADFNRLVEVEQKPLPVYVAPEQAGVYGQEPFGDVRSDLYSLGLILYQAVTGAPLFSGMSIKEALSGVASGIGDLSALDVEIPQRLAQILSTMLEPDPNDRYQNATLLIMDLDAVSSQQEEWNSEIRDIPSSVMMPVVGKKPGRTSIVRRKGSMRGNAAGNSGVEAERTPGGRSARHSHKRSSKANNNALTFTVVGFLFLALFGVLVYVLHQQKKTREREARQQAILAEEKRRDEEKRLRIERLKLEHAKKAMERKKLAEQRRLLQQAAAMRAQMTPQDIQNAVRQASAMGVNMSPQQLQAVIGQLTANGAQISPQQLQAALIKAQQSLPRTAEQEAEEEVVADVAKKDDSGDKAAQEKAGIRKHIPMFERKLNLDDEDEE